MKKDNCEINLRPYCPSDCKTLLRLFCDTVRSVNAADYDEAQIEAWTAGADEEKWNADFAASETLVAEVNGVIAGFGNMYESGYFDRLYVSKDFLRCGVATAIADKLESGVCGKDITVHASVTAKPFFIGRGYEVVKSQTVMRRGVSLTNFVMVKKRD